MRIGFNPNKDKKNNKSNFFHQVIIPVYIPNEEGYFKDSFQILKYCLDSFIITSHTNTYLTVINNGSCEKVINYLENLYHKGVIHELVNTTNIGKLNAILKGCVGHNFDLITITDADVLFLSNWQEETYNVFKNFKKVGVVSPVPSSKVLKQFTSNIIIENLFSKKLKFTNVLNSNALKMFAHSIGNDSFYNDVHLRKNLTIEKQNVKVIVGAGHFVATYRGSIFKGIKQKFSAYSLGGNSEADLLDKPVLKNGLWRVSTENNYAYHMGNVIEPWMKETLKSTKLISNKKVNKPKLEEIKYSSMGLIFKDMIFGKLISIVPIWNLFLRFKGLTKDEANKY
ncbi:glycosyltransferase family 2 protein [Polaribacter sp. ALD11]|uniref:glycosyltransferase family A protein n=1 Tax=Polaribacter sp. ALD11 TaxID=2058137 RepID=UPI000C319F85|nr:glycosyltransferase family A protein [Polaribacter sp. ALD11]AUC84420.1 glycosyltransferase family 2 protein [Polaribacter sp. ALD11]